MALFRSASGLRFWFHDQQDSVHGASRRATRPARTKEMGSDEWAAPISRQILQTMKLNFDLSTIVDNEPKRSEPAKPNAFFWSFLGRCGPPRVVGGFTVRPSTSAAPKPPGSGKYGGFPAKMTDDFSSRIHVRDEKSSPRNSCGSIRAPLPMARRVQMSGMSSHPSARRTTIRE